MPAASRKPPILPVVLLLLFLISVSAAASAVLTSITIDGRMSDWGAVLQDPYQAAADGPLGPLPDRDAPVQSTGRDLTSFAWTFDDDYFYLYTSRSGSSRNRQLFWYYLDINADGLMGTGEPVFHVSWWGRSRRTQTMLYQYLPAQAGGDPLGDATGTADGWSMQGSLAGGLPVEDTQGGSASGTEMEARIPWTVLGVPAGTPFLFHVASSNSLNLPDQIDDNMGGPGGVIGSTFFAGVVLQPDRTGTVSRGGTAALSHTLTNTGPGSDAFTFATTVISGFTPAAVVYYHDLNGNGILDAGEPPFGDSNGDGFADSGLLASTQTVALLAAVNAPTDAGEGDSSTLRLSVRSQANPAASDSVLDTLTIASPAITLVKAVSRNTATPGQTLTYTLTYTSTGSSDAYQAVITDPVPRDTTYVSGSAVPGPALLSFSHDGGQTFDARDAAPVTHIRWTFPTPLPPGGTGLLAFQVTLD